MTSWRTFIEARREEELQRIITEEGLDPKGTAALVENAFRDGAIPMTGTAITRILPPVPRFSADGRHAIKKQTVVDEAQGLLRPLLRSELTRPTAMADRLQTGRHDWTPPRRRASRPS